MKVSLIICCTAFALYVLTAVVYGIKIKKAKKNNSECPKASNAFYGVLASSVFLIFLPVLIPLKPYVVFAVCGCGVLGLYSVLKDRYNEIIKK